MAPLIVFVTRVFLMTVSEMFLLCHLLLLFPSRRKVFVGSHEVCSLFLLPSDFVPNKLNFNPYFDKRDQFL